MPRPVKRAVRRAAGREWGLAALFVGNVADLRRQPLPADVVGFRGKVGQHGDVLIHAVAVFRFVECLEIVGNDARMGGKVAKLQKGVGDAYVKLVRDGDGFFGLGRLILHFHAPFGFEI